jgi:hypothetical protein
MIHLLQILGIPIEEESQSASIGFTAKTLRRNYFNSRCLHCKIKDSSAYGSVF